MKNQEQQIREIKKGLKLMSEGLEMIHDNELAFKDDQWLFDWHTALKERIKVFKTAVNNEFGLQKSVLTPKNHD